ncbi:hypothetical protein F2Q68_00014803 [Brassica cretica]|uniref:Uncharacterized protein n=1 Tax=Brassica cretica TaxID=69181 RepID=A0A8S9HJ17_BRACR|nr:hypothetical protein F2Q68_00014803 [Brassica cretica]
MMKASTRLDSSHKQRRRRGSPEMNKGEKAEEPEDIFQVDKGKGTNESDMSCVPLLHGELEAKSLGAPGTCVAELLEAWILDGVGVEQDGREEMELVQKLEKRDR